MSSDKDKTESTNAVRRFDGIDSDGKRCKKWIRWAKSYLRSSAIPKEEWANKVLTLLDGAADRATEHFDPDKIGYEGAHLDVFQALSVRFPEREENDEVSEAATGIFTFRPEKNERVGLLVGRFLEAVAKSEVHGMTMSVKFQGWLLLMFCRLPRDALANVLGRSRGSWEIDKVAGALRQVYPNGLPAPDPSAKVFMILSQDDIEEMNVMLTAGGDGPAEAIAHEVEQGAYAAGYNAAQEEAAAAPVGPEDPEDELNALVAESTPSSTGAVPGEAGVNPLGAGSEPVEEHDALVALKSWKQTRDAVSEIKKARGLPDTSPSINMKAVNARVRCYNCKQMGHFSRKCPLPQKVYPPKGPGKGGGKGGGAPGRGRAGRGAFFSTLITSMICLFGTSESIQQSVQEQVDVYMLDSLLDPENGLDYFYGATEVLANARVQKECLISKVEQNTTSETEIWADDFEDMTECDVEKAVKSVSFAEDPEESLPPEFSDDWSFQQILYDEQEVFMLDSKNLSFDLLNCEDFSSAEESPSDNGTFLIAPPGSGLPDSGCALTVSGRAAFGKHVQKLKLKGLEPKIVKVERPRVFRFGNGKTEEAWEYAIVPCGLAKRSGLLLVWLVNCDCPFLLSKRLLKELGGCLDFLRDELVLQSVNGARISMKELPSGHYAVDLMDFPKDFKTDGVAVLQGKEISIFAADEFAPECPRAYLIHEEEDINELLFQQEENWRLVLGLEKVKKMEQEKPCGGCIVVRQSFDNPELSCTNCIRKRTGNSSWPASPPEAKAPQGSFPPELREQVEELRKLSAAPLASIPERPCATEVGQLEDLAKLAASSTPSSVVGEETKKILGRAGRRQIQKRLKESELRQKADRAASIP